MGRADYGMLSGKQRVRWALNLPIGIDPSLFLAELVKVRAVNSQVLIIVPDEKDVSQLQRQLGDYFEDHLLIMGSHLPKAQRYRHFLKATYHSPQVIVTTRSGCFLHLSDNATLIVLSDGVIGNGSVFLTSYVESKIISDLNEEQNCLKFITHN